MRGSSQTQRSAAIALVELLGEHPDLADHITWSITRSRPTLTGFVHDGGLRVLDECRVFLGGSISAADAYRRGDDWLTPYTLSSTWRDVPVEIQLSLPVASEAVAA